MSLRAIVWLFLVTGLYLIFELAFNARLLDVVGGTASNDEVHNIEIFGRLLSGTAVALVVLQILMALRSKSKAASPSVAVIAFCCIVVLGLVYVGLQMFVDTLVQKSTPEFRRQSLNIVLVQRALSNGQAVLEGLTDDPKIFVSPEGKAFLALFPLLAVSVDKLDEKIKGAKLELIAQQVGRKLGGVRGYYAKYVEAINQTRMQWQRYSRGGNVGIEAEIARQQERAWNDYLRDLSRRGWTPTTVPSLFKGEVVKRVRRNLPTLSTNWNPSEEESFKAAVEAQVKRKFKAGGDGSVVVRGQRVPPKLEYSEFVMHAGVQSELRERLGVPIGISIAPIYASSEQFNQRLFEPTKRSIAAQEIRKYDAANATFANGGINQEIGMDAARAALVPPIALFCSLLGAIGHLGKLLYLVLIGVRLILVKSRHTAGIVRVLNWAWIAPLLVITGIWIWLSNINNEVTNSRIFGYLRTQVETRADYMSSANTGVFLMNAMHVVAVGQSYGYPINERIRTKVLGGITYGYRPENLK